MKDLKPARLYSGLRKKKECRPLSGLLELTYRCNLDCLHCYCKGLECRKRELGFARWRKILDELKEAGCLFLALSGGDPLVRPDFLEIYEYAKRNGFIVSIFTNGLGINAKIIRQLKKSPPHSVEITLNGITKNTYEGITRVNGTFDKVKANILALTAAKLNVVIKTNSLKQNNHEIAKIKKWAEDLLGGRKNQRLYFKYDLLIFPRLDRRIDPLNSRLSFQELREAQREDRDLWKEYRRGIEHDAPDFNRDNRYLYHCNSWKERFFINPYGRMKFCEFSDKFSAPFQAGGFNKWFYGLSRQILAQRFITDSACRSCNLRPACYYCPARAYLETGNEEGPVSYYCEFAKAVSIAKKGRRI